MNIKAIIIAGIACASLACRKPNERLRISQVYESTNDMTTFVTTDGNLWSIWNNGREYQSNRQYLLEFDTQGTVEPEDDILCSILGIAEIGSYIEENGNRIYDTIDSPYVWEY